MISSFQTQILRPYANIIFSLLCYDLSYDLSGISQCGLTIRMKFFHIFFPFINNLSLRRRLNCIETFLFFFAEGWACIEAHVPVEIQCLKFNNSFFNLGLNANFRAHLSAVKTDDFFEKRNSQQSELLHDKEVDE